MTITTHQQWLVDFYQRRHWYQYSPFVHLNFLTEEVGEVSRAIRAVEIGRDHPGEKQTTPEDRQANLREELADVLDQVLVISSLYDIDASDLLAASETKLTERFKESQSD
ncbi:MazG nucleotide pyrophosphohydrolase domain-containing protein [Levilactobacillus huananensis]|uniref:MazG nucleotide pyrophosphohydrolase domain-containing protein n=1 Tax=Levilactobacillus huananensis TaxID=2486019 RepID=UPI000F786623|nr:MazG nucleotide pyrophosphohydrolase domain-containing protein [Levilactobacillus huananensis]